MTLWDRAFRDSSGGGRDNDNGDDDDQGQHQQQHQQQQQQRRHNNETSRAKKIRRRDMKYKEARDVLAKFSLALKKAFVVGVSSAAKSSTRAAEQQQQQQQNNGIITNNDDESGSFEDEKEEEEEDQQQYHQLEAPNGHFPPLWGLVTQALQISARDSVYVFLLNHAKSLVSAAVRASLIGPYQAQGLLGSVWLRKELERLVDRVRVEEEEEEQQEGGGNGDGNGWRRGLEEAGQGVPAMDIWLGRHELLYSRIFNS